MRFIATFQILLICGLVHAKIFDRENIHNLEDLKNYIKVEKSINNDFIENRSSSKNFPRGIFQYYNIDSLSEKQILRSFSKIDSPIIFIKDDPILEIAQNKQVNKTIAGINNIIGKNKSKTSNRTTSVSKKSTNQKTNNKDNTKDLQEDKGQTSSESDIKGITKNESQKNRSPKAQTKSDAIIEEKMSTIENPLRAVDDNLEAQLNTALNINISNKLLINDTNINNEDFDFLNSDKLSSELGSVVNNQDGTLTYTPPTNFTGTDSFSYTITNGKFEYSAIAYIRVVDLANFPIIEELASNAVINSSTISTSTSLSAQVNHLYLAFISASNSNTSVLSINGMGLTWNLVEVQCSNLQETTLEIWYAQGNPTVGTVSANLSQVTDAAQISLLRISNVDATLPLNVLSTVNPLGEGINATCNTPGINSKNIEYEVSTSTNNTLLISALSYSKVNTHTSISLSENLEIQSGSNPDATGLVIQTANLNESQIFSIESILSIAANWSSISIEVMPPP